MLSTIEAIQIGEGNVDISPYAIDPSVATINGKSLAINQKGGEMQYIVTTSSKNIEVVAPAEFTFLEKNRTNRHSG